MKVSLQSERHRTEWNWVEYRISLKNLSSEPINNPEIRYFAENSLMQYCEGRTDASCSEVNAGYIPVDSMLTGTIDYSSKKASLNVSSVGKYTILKIKMNEPLNGGKSVNVNFRVYRKDWSRWNCSRDWSYQKKGAVKENNYLMAVYDGARNILWGKDPVTKKSNADAVLWTNRGLNTIVHKYDGDTSMVQKAGRFWLIKNCTMNKKETDLLKRIGLEKLSVDSYGEKSAILLKSGKDVKKKVLDSLLYGFYNSFTADDTSKIEVQYKPDDWYEERMVCDSRNTCRTEIVNLQKIEMTTSCWDDVSMERCKAIVDSCGGEDAVIDNYSVWSYNSRKTISCLATHKDVDGLNVIRQEEVSNNTGRRAINLENVQLDEWKIDFTGFNENVTTQWLEGLQYTGENIVVGVYDTGIFFDHDGFNEWDENGVKHPRKAFNGTTQVENGESSSTFSHATHVAGIIGGNGNGSPDHEYRGVAPKVKFYSKGIGVGDQRGHVVNHSHTHSDGYDRENVEQFIFENWKNNTEDTRPKTYVVAAGNYARGFYDTTVAKIDSCKKGMGYHTIAFDTKNGIVVGNYASRTKIPHTSSSYGPTWDGRIKPDIMAPGSGYQASFSPEAPFEAYLDYVKIYHKDEATPHVELDFGTNEKFASSFGESLASSLTTEYDPDASKGLSLKWVNTGAVENYVNWPYKTFAENPFYVKNGDRIVIRLRLTSQTRKMYSSLFKGKVYLASGDEFYALPKSFVLEEYEKDISQINDEYFSIEFNWNQGDILSKFFRLDFNMMDVGIVSSVPCDKTSGGTCYEEMDGTSMAAPYVSGVAALMNQAYMKKMGDETYTHSLRNSTSKVILIHTADDMVDNIGFQRSVQQDVFLTSNKVIHVVYGEGPDFVTGWGSLNAEKSLNMFNLYDSRKKQFGLFREFEIAQNMEKRWTINVKNPMSRLRVSLAWDDYPGDANGNSVSDDKLLQNDLDMYLIGPNGVYHYPWKLDPLSTEHIDINGVIQDHCTDGTENITESDARRPAYKGCKNGIELDESCFDHLNNVEVVDVDLPQQGAWIVVVRGRMLEKGNSADENAQIASIASDLYLNENGANVGCEITHPYRPQSSLSCEYDFGNNMANYVTFSKRTFVGAGDYIQLVDGEGNILGTYTQSALAGKRIRVDSRKLFVTLESDNDENVGYGFSVDRIEAIPYTMLFGISQ